MCSTNASYTIASVQPASAGNYYVVVASSILPDVTTTSASAVLTVIYSPQITAQPANQVAVQGSPATFSVSALGGSLSWQWRSNAVAISGATNSSFTLASAQTNGTFSAVIWNAAGTNTSSNATLTVLYPPLITAPPAGATVYLGDPVNFSVTAAGTAPLRYQWRVDGAAIPGATTSAYTLGSAATNQNYTVVITNAAGAVTSSIAALSIYWPPVIVTPPASQYILTNTAATLSVAVAGAGPFTYRWFKGASTFLYGVTNTSSFTNIYTTAAVKTNTTFYVIIDNQSGSGTASNNATVVVESMPKITAQPTNITVMSGSNATFKANATGSNLVAQWTFNGLPLTNAGATNYTITGVKVSDGGAYALVVTNHIGSATSTTAILTVLAPPAITLQPVNQYAVTGQVFGFSVAATGGNLAYQWFQGGIRLTGYTNSTLSQSATLASAGSYSVVITNTQGAITSSPATLTLLLPPSATTLPSSLADGTNAWLTGAAIPNGLPATAWLQWGSTTNCTNATTLVSIGSGSNTVAISNLLTSLAPFTVYYYQAAASNAAGITFGAISNFTTLPRKVVVSDSRLNPNGSFHLGFAGSANATYSVWFTPDLTSWTRLGNATEASPGLFTFDDPIATNRPARFYQMRLP